MSGTLAWAVVALGLAVVVVRRRSVAVGLVTAQAFVLAGVALGEAGSADDYRSRVRARRARSRARGAVPPDRRAHA